MPSQRPTSPVLAADARSPLSRPHAPHNTSEPVAPLTAAQHLLCAGLEPDDPAPPARHWEQAVWGDFSLERLQTAAAAVAHRHPPLRATMLPEGGQRFGATIPPDLVRVTDASDRAAAEQRRLLAAERERLCLDPDGRLVRSGQLHVLLTGAGTAVITACFARVFFDRESIRRVLGDLLAAYAGAEPGAAGSAEAWAQAYSSFNDVTAAAPEPAGSQPIPPGPELPFCSRERSPVSESGRVTVRLDASVWSEIKRHLVAAGRGASTDALLAETWGSVVALWSRSPRFSLLLDRDARGDGAVPAGITGQFSRTELLTIDESQERPFAERVALVHRTMRSATAGDARAAAEAGVPLPAVAVAMWPPARTEVAAPHFRGDQFVFVGASRPGVALECQAEETPEGALTVHLDFTRGRLPTAVVKDLAGSLETWFRALAAERDAWQLSPTEQAWRMFPAAQLRRRQEANATSAPVASDLLFSGFLRHVTAAPERPAVITPERTLTYGELHGHACRLAHELCARGIRRNELVAIAAEKGWEQVAAALGITLAGAAYLPIDLELPPERIRRLCVCGEARVVVTQQRHANNLPVPDGTEVIALDALAPPGADAAPPDVTVAPDDLAYVIFTSGSTGTPKGVMIDHRGAVNTILDMNTRFRVQPADRVLAISRLSFDLSVYDIFGLLAAGGALVMPAADMVRDPEHWAALVREHRVTIWNTVPALMQLLVDYAGDNPAALGSSLRVVWMSGDWIPLTLPDRIRALRPDVEIVSLGGATEASIWSILYPITTVDPGWRSIPYGRPMVNQTFHVLHENLAPCPEYVPGELFIGGVGVARGYWKDPERTRERFIIHPRTGERLYRTGDLGRYLPDGNIEFLGRADFQVKIRGYRIELGEIEAALAAHERVRAAVVAARGDADANRRLVAYVIADGSAAPSDRELREFLAQRLPDYMVPPTFVFLDRLPLTGNGKVDHKALPDPEAAGTATVRPPPVEPTNELEEVLLQIWRLTLGTHCIGIHDDFFALGGNSLSGTRMIIRLREAFALPLPVQCLFENPTISRLAAAIEQRLLAAEAPTPDPA